MRANKATNSQQVGLCVYIVLDFFLKLSSRSMHCLPLSPKVGIEPVSWNKFLSKLLGFRRDAWRASASAFLLDGFPVALGVKHWSVCQGLLSPRCKLLHEIATASRPHQLLAASIRKARLGTQKGPSAPT